MKRVYITTVVTCAVLIALFCAYYTIWEKAPDIDTLKVGFLYEYDGSSPYTYNFLMVESRLKRELDDKVEVVSRTNVLENETEESLRELVRDGCDLIFAVTYSDQVMAVAEDCPKAQFCQISRPGADPADYPANYHTFNVRLYEARYITGVAAGMKLREMLDAGEITADEALVGFVGAAAEPEIIANYTAFLIGVRSVAPEARLLVKYADAWCSYSREKAAAEALIQAGCRVIAQHTHTISPAVACEEAADTSPVLLIGSNQSMIDIAPTSTLVSMRANWAPYVLGAVRSMLSGKAIEHGVAGTANGNDLCAGFDCDWVQMLEVNHQVAAEGTQARIDALTDQLRRGRINVFRGDYTGVDPDDPGDTVDLRDGYTESARSSYPSFHYLLKDYVTILP